MSDEFYWFAIALSLVLGIVIGIYLPTPKKKEKEEPFEHLPQIGDQYEHITWGREWSLMEILAVSRDNPYEVKYRYISIENKPIKNGTVWTTNMQNQQRFRFTGYKNDTNGN